MEKLKNINIKDYIITFLLTLPLVLIIYNILYKFCNYTNLKDFYVGETIFNDHNKYLDLGIFFVYVILYICILFIVKKFTKIKEQKEEETFSPISTDKFEKIKRFQYIPLFGFLFLHPLDGNFYPIAFSLSIILIFLGFLDIKRRKNKTFSPLAIAGFCFIFYILCNPYSSQIQVVSEEHHLGEKFATYFMHQKYGLEYYKDIMLVHGFFDVIPSWLGNFVFNATTIQASYLGMHLLDNLLFISTITLALYIFSNSLMFAVPLLFVAPNFITLYLVTYVALIVGKLKEKPLLWLLTYILISFLFAHNWTTIGSFCFIATLPIAIYMLIKLLNKKKIIDIAIILLFTASIFYISHDLIFQYLNEAQYYVKGNLIVFGNGFPEYRTNLYYLLILFGITLIKCFALIITPCLIIELTKELFNKTKNFELIKLYTFFILFVVVSIPYTLARLDVLGFSRTTNISFTYLAFVLPYLIYAKNKINKKVDKIFEILLITAFLLALSKIITVNFGNILENQNSNIAKIAQAEKIEKINKINNIVNKYVSENEVFFDLANCGMNYMYTDKKIPVKYVSYYNSISSEQAKNSLKRLMQKPPKLVYLGTITKEYIKGFYYFDNAKQSLRINSIYRWLLLSNKYEFKIYDGYIFLQYNNNNVKYDNISLELLDQIFSFNNLMFLPEVWGNSIKTLPVEKQEIKFNTYASNNSIKIKFEEKIDGKDLQLIMIEPNEIINEQVAYYLRINDNYKTLLFASKRNGKLLIPFDNIPSFMLKNNIKEIEITSDKPIKTERKITFYKRM